MLSDPFLNLLKSDRRYRFGAYELVFESLDYAQRVMGKCSEGKHVTGQDLCIAVREHAFQKYGLMAMTVLFDMGVRQTSDIGNIVYNLIQIGHMNKTESDMREDFDNVFDLERVFREEYIIQ